MSHDPASRIGARLGPWVVDRLLGEGSVAAVYAAHDDGGNEVALKILHPHTARMDDVCRRFLREARVANSIPHSGVVRVLEGGLTDDDCPYLAIELLDGETVEARWERKGHRLSVSEVMWIADQLLDILASAHKKGIVHRDVKPDNLFFTTDRRLKLLDFGIARLADATSTAAGNVAGTMMGSVLGTPAFMPPEQARGDTTEVGIESDLWAVGATMYTLLSGRLVHEEEDIGSQLHAIASRAAPSLGKIAPDVPDAVVGLVDHALAFDRGKRWPRARAMQNALRLAYREMAPRAGNGPIPLEGDSSEPVLRLEKPEAPPMSLRRPRE
jgi:serine/threonine-protein kinase